MRKMKYFVSFLLLFVIIGFASVSITLSIKGNTKILSDVADFKVYFSDVKVGGKSDFSLVKSETELEFSLEFGKIGSTEVITYDVTNGSSVFDAVLNISCSQGNEYLSVVNQFDASNLGALETRRGILTLKKLKSNMNLDLDYSVSCVIDASPVERDSEIEGGAVSPVRPVQISIGDLILISGEKFNVISQTDTTVTMLAQYNLGTTYRQSTIENPVTFSDLNGWEYEIGPTEIDLQLYDGEANKYVNEYVRYLKNKTGVSSLYGNLITLSELKSLGCTVQDDYSYTSIVGCLDLQFDWLVNDQYWWTRSVRTGNSNEVWLVGSSGGLTGDPYNGGDDAGGIRPVITIPINVARKYKVKEYEIGDVVAIGDEKFNIIADNGNMVTMLAQFNLGTDYKQTTEYNELHFGISHGSWEFEESSREILVKDFEGRTSDYLYEYEFYLSSLMDEEYVETDLITLKELQTLGCDIPEDYSWESAKTCEDSPYASWLANGQSWWTRSSASDNSLAVWLVTWNGGLTYGVGLATNGVRPIVRVNKSSLAAL